MTVKTVKTGVMWLQSLGPLGLPKPPEALETRDGFSL